MRITSEIKGLFIISSGTLVAMSLLSFSHSAPESNWIGAVGYFFALCMLWTIGMPAYGVLAYTCWIGWKMLTGKHIDNFRLKWITILTLTLSIAMLLNLLHENNGWIPRCISTRIYSSIHDITDPLPHRVAIYYPGGVPLYALYTNDVLSLRYLLSDRGTTIIFSLVGILSAIILFEAKIISIFHTKPKTPKKETKKKSPAPMLKQTLKDNVGKDTVHLDPHLEIDTNELQPPVDFLRNANEIDHNEIKKNLQKSAAILEETLLSFGIQGKVGAINYGPTIASIEVHPPIGVKVQKIKALEHDIALNLEAPSIRIIAPIPGKAVVGIQVPLPSPQEVVIKDILSSYWQNGKKLHIPLMLGQTVSGDSLIYDLSKMPHCMISGATGSGKSVCINSMIMSILMTSPPDEVRLLLIDPKGVELSAYSKIPQMLAPVITDPQSAHKALRWLVGEMRARYELLKKFNLKNINSFNNHLKHEKQPTTDDGIDKLYHIVVVIDEFADLIMASTNDTEDMITRLAQMSRAVGIHMIIATQRPSREIFTGLIKANFPGKIAFKMTNRTNSQIVLGENGAENLLGNGDMLILLPDSSRLIRAQCAHVSDCEIKRVISYLESKFPTNYLDIQFERDQEHISQLSDRQYDPLFDRAKEFVTGQKKKDIPTSTSSLQRNFRIGYNRAALLMEALERDGVVQPREPNSNSRW